MIVELKKRSFDEMIKYFNNKVADMDISPSYKMELLGMIVAIGFKYEEDVKEPKTGEWNFDGNQMFECTNCGVAYTEYQFEKMRVRYNDPKFPKFCPNCGSYNGGDSDEQQ